MKYLITLIVASVMVFFMIFGCSTEPGRNVSTNNNNRARSGTNNTRNTNRNRNTTTTRTASLDCDLPDACSGSDCCEDDEDCEDQCDDWFSGKAEKECLKLSQEEVDEIDDILEVLEGADEDELEDISGDRVDKLCMILKEIDHKAWLTEIKRYSTAKAKRVLAWMIDDDKVTDLLDSINNDDAVELMESLLSRAGQSITTTTPTNLVKGLETAIGEDNERVLIYADSANNEEFIEWMHENIIEEKICVSPSYPICDGTAEGTLRECTGPEDDTEFAACKLGVYCKVIPPGNDEDVRASIADILGDNDIEDFIGADIGENGLSGNDGHSSYQALDDDDAEEWSDNACGNLKALWDSTLLGLGS